MRNKRYFVFAGRDFYPQGGMNDFVGSVDTLEEVPTLFLPKHTWSSVLDLVTGEEVEDYPKGDTR